MTAEVLLLREAAAKMRERAEAATPAPWTPQYITAAAVPHPHAIDRWYIMGCFDENPRNPTGPAAICEYEPDAEHVASWHPAVALGAAAALDAEADRCTPQPDVIMFDHGWPSPQPALVAFARAYLGRDQ